MPDVSFTLSDSDVDRIAAAVVRQLREQPLPASNGDDRLMTEAEAAAHLCVARHTLRDARKRGEIGFSKIGKQIRYSREQLAALKRHAETNGTVASTEGARVGA